MKLIITAFLYILAGNSLLYNQTIKINERGSKIVEFPDGSWKYFDENDPEDLKLQTSNGTTQSNPNSDLYSHIHKLYEASREKERELIKIKEDNRLEKVMLEYNLSAQKKDLSPFEINLLKEKISLNKQSGKALDKSLKSTKTASKSFLGMLNMESEKRAKAYLKYLKTLSKDQGLEIKKEYVGKGPVVEPTKNSVNDAPISDINPSNPTSKLSVPKPAVTRIKTAEDYAKYNEANDVYRHPISKPCEIEAEGKDEFTGKNRKDLAPEQWLFVTPEPMKKNLIDKEYINMTASLSSISGGTVFLTINITIASQDAPRLFGGLEKGSVVNIKFLDGTNIAIINNRNDFGTINPNDHSVSYRAQCTLGSAIQDMLATKEIDKIRLTWNAGYEDYEVFDIDLLRRQMNCLK